MTDTPSPGAPLRGPRFVAYIPLILDGLRALGGRARRADIYQWLRTNADLAPGEADAHIASGQSKLESTAGWAMFYLSKKGCIHCPERSVWALTEAGRDAHPSHDEAYALFREVHASYAPGRGEEGIDESPAPAELQEETATIIPPLPEAPTYWFAGITWGTDGDQLERFIREGIWENGYEDQFVDKVKQMRPGERIAAKSTFVRRNNLPFDNHGQSVSVMRIKATGTIVVNPGDGKRVHVVWDPVSEPREWYFWTFRNTLSGLKPSDDYRQKLIAFAFRDAPQDYAYWLDEPYWVKRYRAAETAVAIQDVPTGPEDVEEQPVEAQPHDYTTASIVADGCFLAEAELDAMLERLRTKMNLVLQGPPGTGKTWLAKRLAAALIGCRPATAASRLAVVQFHPSLSYEDFVRGWRPSADGKLILADGVFLEAVREAQSDPNTPFVFVIEEINRGNPAQIFGELLTLLEHDNRHEDEAIALAYPDPRDRTKRTYLPENLYVVGTMNVADRSLALVDLALRRRFAFVGLRPQFNEAWQAWCVEQGKLGTADLTAIAARMNALNDAVASALGEQFRIGHSYLTPAQNKPVADGRRWFAEVIETEIGPLLDEYFFDAPETAKKLRLQALAGW